MQSLSLTAGFFIFCTCHFWGSFPFFSLLKSASSACKYLHCVISDLTQGGKGCHLFRLIGLVVLWRGSDSENKHHWHKWWALLLDRQHWACHSPRQHALPRSKPLTISGVKGLQVPGSPCVPSRELASVWDSWLIWIIPNSRKMWLATGSLLTAWQGLQSLEPRCSGPFPSTSVCHAPCLSASNEGHKWQLACSPLLFTQSWALFCEPTSGNSAC